MNGEHETNSSVASFGPSFTSTVPFALMLLNDSFQETTVGEEIRIMTAKGSSHETLDMPPIPPSSQRLSVQSRLGATHKGIRDLLG